MVESYNCLRLDNSYVFQIDVYKSKDSDMKFFEVNNNKKYYRINYLINSCYYTNICLGLARTRDICYNIVIYF